MAWFLYILILQKFKGSFCKIKKIKKIENMFLKMLKLMYIMFTYGDNYVEKQASSNCEDAVTAHFVAPAQFVAGDKMCTLNGTFCSTLHTLSPENDNMCSRSRHILSPLKEHQRTVRIYIQCSVQCYLAFGI